MKLPEQKLIKLEVRQIWTTVGKGALLGISVPDIGPVVAMRSEVVTPNGTTDALLILSGDNPGGMFADLGFLASAIELSTYQLGIENAVVERYEPDPAVGTIVRQQVGPKFYMRTGAANGTGAGWVCIESAEYDAGRYRQTLPAGELLSVRGDLSLIESSVEGMRRSKRQFSSSL